MGDDRALYGKYTRAAILAAVLLLGLSVRLLGIRFGLPYHHHWDEVWIVDSAAGMLRRGDDVPASYQYGAPLSRLTALAFVVVQRARGAPPGVTPDDAQVTLYLLARVMTALVSSSGIVAVYLAARWSETSNSRARATVAALCAALLYAVASELVMHSRYAVTDACLVGLTAWTLAFAAAYVASRKLAWGLASVLAAGVTFAFKAPGIPTSLIPLAALVACPAAPGAGRRSVLYRMLLTGAVPMILGCYVVLNPHVLDHSSEAVRDLVGRYKQTRDGGFSSVYLREPGLPHLASALWAIVGTFLHRSVPASLLLSAISLAGIAVDLRRRRVVVGIAFAHAIALTLSVSLPNRTFLIRNYLVVIPCLCMGFGVGLVEIGEAIRARCPSRGLRLAALAALTGTTAILLVAMPVRDAISAERLRQDPRERAIDWIAGHVPAGSVAAVGVTPGVLGKSALGGQPELAGRLRRPNLRIAPTELDACPSPEDGPEYVVNASYRDTNKADRRDPWEEQWLFRDCPGYEQMAAFGPNPYEHNVDATPTWFGRVSAAVLRRVE
jgi:hypothetical protein